MRSGRYWNIHDWAAADPMDRIAMYGMRCCHNSDPLWCDACRGRYWNAQEWLDHPRGFTGLAAWVPDEALDA